MDEEKKETKVTPIKVDKGELLAADSKQLVSVITQLIKGGGVPRHLQSIEEVIAAWNFAAQLKLPPQPALRNIAVIHGTPSLFGDLPLALAQRTGEVEIHEEYTIDDAYKKISMENKNLNAPIFAAICKIKRKGQEPNTYHFTVEEAKRAGLWDKRGKKSGEPTPWVYYPQVMLTRRARSIALKAEFADALSGAAIAEYDYGRAPDMEIDVTPREESESKLAKLNQTNKNTDESADSSPRVAEDGGLA